MFSLQALFDQINLQNDITQYPLSEQNVQITNVGPSTSGFGNTKATLVALAGSPYESHVDIFYNRIDLATLLNGTGVISKYPFTLDVILQKISANWLAFLASSDVLPVVIPDTSDGEIHDITLTANPSSPICFGSVVISLVQVDLDPLDTLLNVTLPSGYL